jgi:phosphoglucosamine mutase
MGASPQLFGTDGMRAPFGEHPLDRPTVTALGFHLGQTLGERAPDPLVILGGDTRDSTPILGRWMAEGLIAAGARCRDLGVVPTPAVAWRVRDARAAAGVAISASHNPWPDNGIKLFDAHGRKWAPEREAALEGLLASPAPAGSGSGSRVVRDTDGVEAYLDQLAGSLGGDRPLAGLAVVLDSAHGATSAFASRIFTGCGADVVRLFDQPDGRNINDGCGSTHPEALAATVAELGADLGVAFDCDGDRALLVDERGEVRDGDAMLYLWALALAERNELEPRRIVATSMSNIGLERSLAPWGIGVERCDVGDRTVVVCMEGNGILLGGEQSGHLVSSRLASTGDGLLTALHLAAIRARARRPLSEMLAGFVRFPQILRNVPVPRKVPFEQLPRVQESRERIAELLGEEGRLVLRYSGTEPLARVMIEGPDADALERWAGELEAALAAELGSADRRAPARVEAGS